MSACNFSTEAGSGSCRCGNARSEQHGLRISDGWCNRYCGDFEGDRVTALRVGNPPPRRAREVPLCDHFGKRVIRQIGACGGYVVHPCALHGECTMQGPSHRQDPRADGVRMCGDCSDNTTTALTVELKEVAHGHA